MEALFCLFISSRTNAAQRRSSSVAFRGANKIILACVLLPQTPPLEMLLGRVGCWVCVCVGRGGLLWVPVCCAMKRVECILHSWVTNPHDVIVMLTQCFFCTRYPQDKRKIKRGAAVGILCVLPTAPRLLNCLFVFDFAFVHELLFFCMRAIGDRRTMGNAGAGSGGPVVQY